MSGRQLQLLCAVLCSGLAMACLWFAFDQWPLWHSVRASFVVVLCAFAVLFALTAISVTRRWRVNILFATASGWLLILYALAVILVGWEDVGGARGALPLSVATGVVGAVSLLVARRARRERRQAVDTGELMSEQASEIRLEGIVHASGFDPAGQGKQFLGAAIECSDGTVWVIAYGEQSSFHAFAGRRVVVSGRPHQPEGQYLIGWRGAKLLRYFRVSTIRLAE